MRNRENLQLRSIILLALLIGATLPAAIRAQDDPGGTVSGSVRDRRTQQPIASARVDLGGTIVITDPQGRIASTTIPFDGPTRSIDVRATAQGYASWRFDGVELRSDQPVELQLELGDTPVAIMPDRTLASAAATIPDPPEYINVARTFNTACVYPPVVQRVDRMLFSDYVRNVLPNEWVASWPSAALDAGAVAVSQYAWSVAFAQRKWTARGYPFDVVDSTCDQVYKDRDPTRSYATTDAAVTRMLGTALLRNDALITTFYRAKDEQCGTNLDCMGQWGSYNRAQVGESGLQILRTYYGRKAPVSDVPPYAASLLDRSGDITIAPGMDQIVSVNLCNRGTYRWNEAIELQLVDPGASGSSPFAHATWLDPQHPAAISESAVARGERGSWSFTVSAPTDLVPGSYTLAVQPVRADGTPITTDQPIVWNISVVRALTPTAELTPRGWLPFFQGVQTVAACS